MRSRYKIAELEAPHFFTCTIVGWLPVFTRTKYLDIITAALTFCRQQKGLRLHAYVILDNHLHLLVSADNLSQVIRGPVGRESAAHPAINIIPSLE